MPKKEFEASNMPRCDVCNKQAVYECSQCEKAFYCSQEHQVVHWKEGHKINCKSSMPLSTNLKKNILNVRKSYFEHFSHEMLTSSLLDAKVLTGLEQKQLALEPSTSNQLNYGSSVCLLVKTYLLLNDKKGAKSEMQAYLKDKKNFISDMSNIPCLEEHSKIIDNLASYLQKKLNLISCIANLCYAIGIQCISYYVLYTKIIIQLFGANSIEASNCYYLLGCYFADEGFFRKAIECFKKAANVRGPSGGDCYYNLGVLHQMQKQSEQALPLLQKALDLRKEQYGQNSPKVAEVYEMMGIIFTETNDFKTAMNHYEKSFLIRKQELKQSNRSITPEYKNIISLIHQLENKLHLFIEEGQPMIKKPEIYQQLKSSIEHEKNYADEEHLKRKSRSIQQQPQTESSAEKKDKKAKKSKMDTKKPKWQLSLVIHEQFTDQLNLAELFRLSELQIELEKCGSQFEYIYTIGNSPFYENLTDKLKKLLEQDNKKLFELIKLEDIKSIKESNK